MGESMSEKSQVKIKKPKTYTTFSKKLDDLLVGGYKTGNLLHIYGEPKVGKTTLSVYLPIISIMKEKKELKKNEMFLVISTDKGFSIERLEELCKMHGVNFTKVIEHLLISKPNTFYKQYYVVVKELPRIIEEKSIKPLLVALDSATLLYKQEYKDVPQKEILLKARELRPKLEAQLKVLLDIADEYDCITTVTNIRKGFIGMTEEERKRQWDFYAGNLFAYLPYATIRLSRIEKTSDRIIAERIMHRYAGYKRVVVRLTEKGFEDE